MRRRKQFSIRELILHHPHFLVSLFDTYIDVILKVSSSSKEVRFLSACLLVGLRKNTGKNPLHFSVYQGFFVTSTFSLIPQRIIRKENLDLVNLNVISRGDCWALAEMPF